MVEVVDDQPNPAPKGLVECVRRTLRAEDRNLGTESGVRTVGTDIH